MGEDDEKTQMGPAAEGFLAGYFFILAVVVAVALPAFWPTSGEIRAATLAPEGTPVVNLSIVPLAEGPRVAYQDALLYLAATAGVTGGLIHAVMSFARYKGARRLGASWFWWYVFLPVVGGLLGATVLGLLMGGILILTSGALLSPAAVLGVGVLSGMFSKSLTRKLGILFNKMLGIKEDAPDGLDETPRILDAEIDLDEAKDPRHRILRLKGEYFEQGATLLLDGEAHKEPLLVADAANASTRVSRERLDKGVKTLRVDNPNREGVAFPAPFLVLGGDLHSLREQVKALQEEANTLKAKLGAKGLL